MGSEAVSKRAAISVPIFDLVFMVFLAPKGGGADVLKWHVKSCPKTKPLLQPLGVHTPLCFPRFLQGEGRLPPLGAPGAFLGLHPLRPETDRQ